MQQVRLKPSHPNRSCVSSLVCRAEIHDQELMVILQVQTRTSVSIILRLNYYY